MGKDNVCLRQPQKCLTVAFRSHYQEMRDNAEMTYTRRQLRELLYAFARPLVPLWDEKELYESVDEFLDGMEQ